MAAVERDPAVPLRGHGDDRVLPRADRRDARKVTQEHEILIAVQVDARRARSRRRRPRRAHLVEQTERVAQGLEAAEVTVLGALSAGQLARTLRTAFDPYAAAELAALEATDPAAPRPRRGQCVAARQRARPGTTTAATARCTPRTGSARWPRVDVSPMFMDALLGQLERGAHGRGDVRADRAASAPRARSRRRSPATAPTTSCAHRFGQSETARQRQAAGGDATRREAELAAGHGEVRLAGFVTVSGPRPPTICAGPAPRSTSTPPGRRLELHRMYGQQADAFTFTLPLCRGLR